MGPFSNESVYTYERLKNMANLLPRAKPLKRGHYEDVRREVKPSRNEPCPCGSNKKYKHCCSK